MFNFNYYFLLYFLKHNKFAFSLFHKDKCHILNELIVFEDIKFIYKKSLKTILVSYLVQHTFLFLSFIFLGFFLFSSIMNFFHFDSFLVGFDKTFTDFIVFHYVSFFIVLLSLFSVFSCLNAFMQSKIDNFINKLKTVYFPVSYYFPVFKKDLDKLHTLPLYEIIYSNDNLYGLLLLLIFLKHIEKEELKLIPEYFIKHW